MGSAAKKWSSYMICWKNKPNKNMTKQANEKAAKLKAILAGTASFGELIERRPLPEIVIKLCSKSGDPTYSIRV